MVGMVSRINQTKGTAHGKNQWQRRGKDENILFLLYSCQKSGSLTGDSDGANGRVNKVVRLGHRSHTCPTVVSLSKALVHHTDYGCACPDVPHTD